MGSQTSIYLIRHGIAAERGTYTDDDDRPLIKRGRRQVRKVAKKLRSLELNFDTILTSPLVRAIETAEILKEAGLCQKVTEFTDLAPMGSFSNWLKWLGDRQKELQGENIALVGHQPDLANWAEILVWGNIQDKIDLKKSGIIGIRLTDSEDIVGNCALFWLTAPNLLLK